MKIKNERNKRGYLNEDFLLFHLKDRRGEQFDYHCHDFYKIVFFVAGNVTYLIEGKAYNLNPGDILLVSDQDIHKVIIDPNEDYERYILWFNPSYVIENSTNNSDLLSFFHTSQQSKQKLLLCEPEELRTIQRLLYDLKRATSENAYGNDISRRAIFLLIMVSLNRIFLQTENTTPTVTEQDDVVIISIIDYINAHLADDLTIDKLSDVFFISHSTLMHKFKEQTGISLHAFVTRKRLLSAKALLKQGIPAMEVSYRCGFKDYSSFYRAFKKLYGISPKEFINGVC